MSGHFGDALRLIRILGKQHPHLSYALEALGLEYRPPEEEAKSEPCRLSAQPLDDNLMDLFEPSVEAWHFPIVVNSHYEKRGHASANSLLKQIGDYEVLEFAKKKEQVPPISLWCDRALKHVLTEHVKRLKVSRKLDMAGLTCNLAKREPLKQLPYRKECHLPAEIWLYTDTRGHRLIYQNDYKALYVMLCQYFGAAGIGKVVQLIKSCYGYGQCHRLQWRASQKMEGSAVIKSGELPLPPVGASCMIVTDDVQEKPWSTLLESLQQRAVQCTVIPFNLKRAVSQRFYRLKPQYCMADHNAMLCALSLTPMRFSLGLIRALRIALTQAGPELEYKLLATPGMHWQLAEQYGEWHEGFCRYQKQVKQVFANRHVEVTYLIEEHLKQEDESVLREHQLLALRYLHSEDAHRKRIVEHYYRMVASRFLNQFHLDEAQWWLERGLSLGGMEDKALYMPIEMKRVMTLANKKWQEETRLTDQLPASHLDSELWLELESKSAHVVCPGALKLDVDRIKVLPLYNSGAETTGVSLAHLQECRQTFVSPERKRNKPWLIPKHRQVFSVDTPKEMLKIQALNSHDFYWAQSVSVTEAGVVAKTEQVELCWPSAGDHQGPVITVQPGAPRWLRTFVPQWDEYGLYVEINVGGEILTLRYIPPGSFLMGSPDSEPKRFSNELQHAVTLTQGFWLGETAVTQALWQVVMGDNPSYFKSESEALPVEQVSWDDCQAFFEKLNARLAAALGESMGEELTFPTEAQWEYACRAGSCTAYATGDRMTIDQANLGGGGTVDVSQFIANSWGLYQMHGNVYEWCLDGHRDYQAHPVTDPVGDLEGPLHFLRGGCWVSNAQCCRSASRDAYSHGFRRNSVGVRVAMVPQASEFVSKLTEPSSLSEARKARANLRVSKIFNRKKKS